MLTVHLSDFRLRSRRHVDVDNNKTEIDSKVGPAAVAGGGMLIWSMMPEAKTARHLSASIT
jgi:hypothetical protein